MKHSCLRDTKGNENVIPRLNRGIQEDIDCPIKHALEGLNRGSGNDKKGYFRSKFQILLIVLVLIGCYLPSAIFAEETKESKWGGVDESVVEKYAKEHGREAREPLINTDQGDLLLFVFLLAGAVGGFIGGYYWRILIVEKAPKGNRQEQKITG